MIDVDFEYDESTWLEEELIDREAYISENLLPNAYEMMELLESAFGAADTDEADVDEMMDFIESTMPAMFVCIRGKNYLLKKEELV